MFKSLRCTIIDPNIEKLSQQVLLDYIEDKDTDESESSAVEEDEEDEDEEENEGVDEDCEDEDTNIKAKGAKSSQSKPNNKISLSNSMSKISLTEKTLILVSNDIQKTNEYLDDLVSSQTEVIIFLENNQTI